MHILNIIQADSGIEIWLIKAGIVSPHIQVYSEGYTYRGILAHIRAYFRKFRHIQNSGITGLNNVNEYLLFKSGTSITVQIYLKHFCFKSIHSLSFSSGQYFNDNNSNNNSMPPVQTHHSAHSRYTRQHATHVGMLLRKECYRRHPHYTRKHATHVTHVSTNITPFLKLCLYKRAF